MQDLKTLDEEELEQLRIDVLNEIERRNNLASIPNQVKQLTSTYVNGGGDRGDLLAAVSEEELERLNKEESTNS